MLDLVRGVGKNKASALLALEMLRASCDVEGAITPACGVVGVV